MAGIPGYLLRFVAVIEPYQGAGAHGPILGSPGAPTPCFAEVARRLSVDRESRRITASATVWLQLGVTCPPESMVTVLRRDGSPLITRTRVLASTPRDGGGLPVPSHLEIALQ
ncbi:hypothetical protein [Frankia sp. AgB32]|uniref:hypothetical protein n=1 Tax=Frankia sp. AgB32 TaxID=631119 RepID=UPI00200E4AB0|nr:hypothetical protein [Frankia sp. AgB32]MCK9896972.1 hypothetical protein [Frankia sp. AgB32]